MFAEDITAFFDTTSGFAQAVTIGGSSASAIFDNGYSAANAGGMSFASTMPTLSIPTASVPTNPVGMTVVVGSVSYTIAEHQPDGTGISALYLERTL